MGHFRSPSSQAPPVLNREAPRKFQIFTEIRTEYLLRFVTLTATKIPNLEEIRTLVPPGNKPVDVLPASPTNLTSTANKVFPPPSCTCCILVRLVGVWPRRKMWDCAMAADLLLGGWYKFTQCTFDIKKTNSHIHMHRYVTRWRQQPFLLDLHRWLHGQHKLGRMCAQLWKLELVGRLPYSCSWFNPCRRPTNSVAFFAKNRFCVVAGSSRAGGVVRRHSLFPASRPCPDTWPALWDRPFCLTCGIASRNFNPSVNPRSQAHKKENLIALGHSILSSKSTGAVDNRADPHLRPNHAYTGIRSE